MLEGGDPWRVDFLGSNFAGPPTTLVPFIPFAYLPQQAVASIWMGGSLILAVLILRRLRLPSWWLAFPPLFFPIVMGSVEVLMVALLVSGGARSGLALVLKPYASLPLLAERRWHERDARFDVIGIRFDREPPAVEHVRGAFEVGG